jgi:predicted glycoside hydrolase/deacetylase ChbG (UPF0249 family)
LATVARELVVNADDFGQSVGINRGVIKAHECGIVTSASLMVRWPAAADAVARADVHRALGLGLHVDLGEWTVQRDGEWRSIYEVVPREDAGAVREELYRQLEQFRSLTGNDPTHLDSHQHVHRAEPVRSLLSELARDLDVPLRHYSPMVRYCGAFYGQANDGQPCPGGIAVDALLALIADFPQGITELSCHPSLDDNVESMYRSERTMEMSTLCDPRVRDAVSAAGVRLRSFRNLDGRHGRENPLGAFVRGV